MTDPDGSDSPLRAAAGAAEPATATAFGLLGNETRLAILLALWEAYAPGERDSAVSFSDLYERVDYDDPGNFSYHLEQLTGQFVRKRDGDEGYELRDTGLDLVKTVIAGAGVTDAEMAPAEIDRPCSLCGAPTEVRYHEGVLYQVCTECEGIATDSTLPDGYLNATAFHPAGLTGRTAEEIVVAAEVAAHWRMQTMYAGICCACSGPVDSTLQACTDHASAGICDQCGKAHAFWARFECRVCKDHHVTTPEVITAFHPAVIALYYRNGVAPTWHAAAHDGLRPPDRDELRREAELLDPGAPRVAVTVSLEGESVTITYDEAVQVVAVE